MGNWVKGFSLFLADMYRHMVGKLTGFLSIVLALAPLWFPDFFSGNKGLLHSKWMWETAAAVSFFLASYSAWREQHQDFLKAEELVNGRKPRIVVSCFRQSGFQIVLLGGEPPQYLKIDPIQTNTGSSVSFDPIDFVTAGAPTTLRGIMEISSIRTPLDMGKFVIIFFKGRRSGSVYPIRIKYKWNNKSIEDSFSIGWDSERSVFDITPLE
jgi:hypothetical protein